MPDPSYSTPDNENFTAGNPPPSQINQIIWQGLEGVYLAAGNDGLLKTIDMGANWGFLRPASIPPSLYEPDQSTTWPVGAVAHQVAFVVGPKTCEAVIDTIIPWINASFAWIYWTPDEWIVTGFTINGLNGPILQSTSGEVWLTSETGIPLDGFDRTTDKGVTTSSVGFPDHAEAGMTYDQVFLAMGNDDRLWGAFRGGDTWWSSIYYSDDFGDNWTFSWGSNIGSTSLYNIAVDRTGQTIVLVLQDAVDGIFLGTVISTNGGSSWVESGDIADAGFTTDYAEPLIFSDGSIVILETNYSTLEHRLNWSADGGSTWTTVQSYTEPIGYFITNLSSACQCLMEDDTGIYVVRVSGQYGIIRTTDQGATWEFIGFNPGTVQPDGIVPSGNDLYILENPVGPGSGFWKLPDAATTLDGTLIALANVP